MKKLIYVPLLLLLLFCKDKTPLSPETSIPTTQPTPKTEIPEVSTLIIPGGKIGNIRLEMNSKQLTGIVGTPDLSDAAMGKAWLTWYSSNSDAISGKYELNIFTTYKNNEMKEKVVRLVRITSPDFKTIDSLSTRQPIDLFEKKHPNLKYVGNYTFETTKNFVELYDDRNSGIAFEFLSSGESKYCIAIIIHQKGKDVIDYYRTFRPDIVLVN